SIPPQLIGQPLSIRLDISATQADRSTHFDDVRVYWSQAPPVPVLSPLSSTVLIVVLGVLGRRNARRAR
ncbi:MAG: hypothetical protein GY733_01910, partial [bacterium]|nr:hypothetical protein [bacterium]